MIGMRSKGFNVFAEIIEFPNGAWDENGGALISNDTIFFGCWNVGVPSLADLHPTRS